MSFQVGVRESAQSWRELLVNLRSRGRSVPPDAAVGDGAFGFWKPMEEIFPGTRRQRCWTHEVSNALNKVPKMMLPAVKADLREIWQADSALWQRPPSIPSPKSMASNTKRPPPASQRTGRRC